MIKIGGLRHRFSFVPLRVHSWFNCMVSIKPERRTRTTNENENDFLAGLAGAVGAATSRSLSARDQEVASRVPGMGMN